MVKDINKDVFPEETLLKLEIFAKCFREWFPVFLYNSYIEKKYIVDFFAGSGKDINGNLASPLLLLEEAKGANCGYCNIAKNNNKAVHFIFNEIDKQKLSELKVSVESSMDKCAKENCKRDKCIYSFENFRQYDFKDIVFRDSEFANILSNRNYAKFLLLDQYGFKQVDERVFLKLVDSPTTDFIFFISSSTIKRFKEHDVIKKYFDTLPPKLKTPPDKSGH